MTLRSRLLAAFLALALVPTALLGLVALTQLSRAIARWYRPAVDRTMVAALDVTQTAITRLSSGLLADVSDWSTRWPAGPTTAADRRALQTAMHVGGADFVEIYRSGRGGWHREDAIAPPGVLLADAPDLSDALAAGAPHPQSVRTSSVLAAAAPLRDGRLLVVGLRLSPDYFAQVDSIGRAVTYYRQLGVTAEIQRRVALALVALLGVAWIAIAWALSAGLARQMSLPLRELSAALGRVAGGALETRVAPQGAAELRSLGQSFNAMTERLEEAREAVLQAEREAAWRDVARKLAHEFKNTLTPMRLSLQLLEARLEDTPASEPAAERSDARDAMRKSLASALREVDSLNRLAAQFSQYARLPEPNFEPLDGLEVARAAAALVAERPIGVRAEAGSTALCADRVLLSRALNNLLLNACEASPPASPVELVVAPRDGVVGFEVLDRGAGIPAELEPRLFEPYVSTKKRGSGLGLSLVRDIARQHHGSITLERRDGGGASARLILPRDPATVPALPVSASRGSDVDHS